MNLLQSLGILSTQAAVLALLALVLTRVLRSWLTPRARCWIWGLVVLRLCLPVSLDAPFSLFNLVRTPAIPLPSGRPTEAASSASPTSPHRDPGATTPAPTVSAISAPVRSAQSPVEAKPAITLAATATTEPVPTVIPPPPQRAPAWPRLALWAWLLGVFALLARTFWLAFRMHRTVRTGTPVTSGELVSALDQARQRTGVNVAVRIVSLPGLETPALYGCLRPTLLVPPDLARRLEPTQLRHILLHECAHVRRRDIALNWLMAFLQALHWFNPLVWFAFARLRAERELACDEIALEASGQEDGESYGRTLLHLLSSWSRAGNLPSPGAVGILERHGDLRRRLAHIADFRRGRRLGLPVLALIALAGAATLTDAQSPKPPESSPALAGSNLPPVVALRYTNALTLGENRDFTTGANWAKAPRGSNVLGGVHFHVDGLIQLASRRSVDFKREFREHVSLPAPTNRYGSVHLLAATAWSAEPNRRIADVIWRYADGSSKRSPILYTGHVRDHWRRPFEEPRHVFSRLARCAVTWTSADAERNRAACRMYRVTLANPEPSKPVAFLQLQSSMDDASLLVLAVSLDPLEAGKRPDPGPDAEPEDPKWTRHLGVTVIDAGTSNVVGGASVKASVTFGDNSISRDYTANGSGVADVLLPEEPVTAVTLEASAKDYSATKHRLVFSASNPPPAFVTVRLHGGATIGGVILNNAGEPVAGAQVRVYRYWTGSDRMDQPGEDTGFSSKSATTGDDGRWEVGALPKHRFNRIGFNVQHSDYVQASIPGISQDSAVEEALLAKRHELRLTPALTISGIVLDPDGQPVPGAEVRAGERFSGRSADGKSDANGRFRIGGQAVGETVVSARANGFGGVAQKVSLSADMAPITLTLTRGHVFSGIVTDAANTPIADAWLAVDPVHGPDADPLGNELAEFSTRTGADGRWQWKGGPDKTLSFRFEKPGYAGKSGVKIRPNEPATTVLNKPREIAGVVIDTDSGEPVKEFRLEPRGNWWSSSDARSFSTPDGRFNFELPQEHYDRLHVSSPTHDPAEEPIPPSAEGVLQMTIRLKKSEDWSGVVVDASGRPVPNATVALASPSEGVVLQGDRLDSWSGRPVVITGTDGAFNLEPGKRPVGVVAAASAGFGFTPIEEFRATRRVRLAPFGAIEGVYRGRVDADGGARLHLGLFTGEGGAFIGVNGGWGGGQNPTQKDAPLRFTKVPAGNHQLLRLVQSTGSFMTHSPLKDIRVEAGKTTQVEIRPEGVRVVARLSGLPAGNPPSLQWNAQLSTASPWTPKPGMTPEQIQQLIESPEFQKAMRQVRHYACSVNADGTLEALDVLPGAYDLHVAGLEVTGSTPEVRFNGSQSFTVPQDAAVDSVINLGTIPVQAMPRPAK